MNNTQSTSFIAGIVEGTAALENEQSTKTRYNT